MAKKQFKAESKRLLDLMINSIYTHKEIFLRELISNASDAVDKLCYRSLTDDGVGLNRSDFKITLIPDKEARTLTIVDNGIGMTKEELESNLGTIARSGSLQFKKEMEGDKDAADIIGQFGVGFYSAFMVADQVVVRTRAYGSDEAWQWSSTGADGYTVAPCDKADVGSEVVLHIKAKTEEEDFDQYLEPYRLDDLVKKYSDYIHYPIVMEMEHTHAKPKPADAGEDYKPEYETVKEWETLNSMVPLWQRPRGKVKKEEYNAFYKEKFGDWADPALTVHVAAEGQVEYKAMLFVPSQAPFNYYSRDYEKGLQLYSSGVLIMDKCADLIGDHFSFVRGVVDSPDLPLNISREMLQHTKALRVIAANLEKKIKSELVKLQQDDKETYGKFWAAFGRQLKYGVVSDYGAHKDLLADLLLFPSSAGEELTTLNAYVDRMREGQDKLYYLRAESAAQGAKLPQAEALLDKGYEILFLTDEVDEFVINALGAWKEKPFKNAADPDALPLTDEEKAAGEKKAEEYKAVLDFVKETLGGEVHAVRLSQALKSAPVCLTAEGPISLDMERYFQKVDPEQAKMMKAQRVLELNAQSAPFAALAKLVDTDKDKAADYAKILYCQALLLAGLPLPDPAEYTRLVCSLM